MEGTTVTMSVAEYDSLRKCKEALEAGHKHYVNGPSTFNHYTIIERDELLEKLFKYISDLNNERNDLLKYKYEVEFKKK